ncbi:hypothetical protein [Psychromicrobium lacuslunae]|uniref:PBP domain-containing protein n=1 Tax=Psychromicrobium lacuslunae TaxID=1618207 RepID=A0A0D4BYU7_9MICC|nr:hypothetical protein [Psychromicrobium lacuslunae]AJT41607.1 hypothetical protein UM93_08930 [Psychromicrobium lacuslunae]
MNITSVRRIAATMTVAALASLLFQPASAQAAEGSWGPQGDITNTSSAVTVRWDNAGNLPSSVVSRSNDTVLAHTAGKTYQDIDQGTRARYQEIFGGLSMSVSQTKDLVNQSISVSVSGAHNEIDQSNLTSFMQFFQCWGAPGPDGKPDPNATSPDPATCQVGAGGTDSDATDTAFVSRIISEDDKLLTGGDWDAQIPGLGDPRSNGLLRVAPFTAVSGTKHRGTEVTQNESIGNPFFNRTTTNEISKAYLSPQGSVTRPVEVQTGAEANGLGCGKREDNSPSVSSCWLIAVPRLYGALDTKNAKLNTVGPVAPSVWAQRLQVKLDFQDVRSGCSSDAVPNQINGAEQMSRLMKSWIPALCDNKKTAFSFNPLGETQVRGGFSSKPGGMLFGSQAISSSTVLQAPIGLTGVVIAYNISLTDQNGAAAKGLKLNARLVAKLLTQFYDNGIDLAAGSELFAKAPWARANYATLKDDAEFKKLNPDLNIDSAPNLGGDLLVETLRSDAAYQVWQWILDDQAASSFLSGCPDPSGKVINPYFSMRSYAGCENQKETLEKDLTKKLAETKTPKDFQYQLPDYTSGFYPQPAWYERSAKVDANGKETISPLRIGDLRPRSSRMDVIGRETSRPVNKVSSLWCDKNLCLNQPDYPLPGVWKSTGDQNYANKFLASITDAATAAQFQLPTALLCNTEGTSCSGADTSSLQKAANNFQSTDVAGVLKPATKPDYAGGAYPLTLPVYAAVNTNGLTQDKVNAYRTLFEHAAGAGQTAGYTQGSLPPGYAPLTESMLSALKKTAGLLKAAPSSPSTPSPTSPSAVVKEPKTDPTAPTPKGDDNAPPPAEILPPDKAPTDDAPADKAGTSNESAGKETPAPVSQAGTTSPLSSTWPQYLLLIGLGIALLAGLLSPLIGRGRKQ